MYRQLNIIPYHQCDKLLGLAKGLENHQIYSVENYYQNKTSRENVHVNDVVTDWSYALAGFLVSTLFGVSCPTVLFCMALNGI